MSRVFAFPDQAIVDPITIRPDLCTGCNLCMHVCPVDLFLPNARPGAPPHVLYPGECWYEGSCVDVCPEPGAIVLNRPPAMRVNWKPRSECYTRDGSVPVGTAGDGKSLSDRSSA